MIRSASSVGFPKGPFQSSSVSVSTHGDSAIQTLPVRLSSKIQSSCICIHVYVYLFEEEED